jgi:hypothetical protein
MRYAPLEMREFYRERQCHLTIPFISLRSVAVRAGHMTLLSGDILVKLETTASPR